MAKRTTKTESKFEDQIRFNWGYHDAVQAVREGWAVPERNFGFALSGKLRFATADDVRTGHFDPSYGEGWIRGYHAGISGNPPSNSSQAWSNFQLGIL